MHSQKIASFPPSSITWMQQVAVFSMVWFSSLNMQTDSSHMQGQIQHPWSGHAPGKSTWIKHQGRNTPQQVTQFKLLMKPSYSSYRRHHARRHLSCCRAYGGYLLKVGNRQPYQRGCDTEPVGHQCKGAQGDIKIALAAVISHWWSSQSWGIRVRWRVKSGPSMLGKQTSSSSRS